jgi:hypothetical protein
MAITKEVIMKKLITVLLVVSLSIFTPMDIHTAKADTTVIVVTTDKEYTIIPGDKLPLSVDTNKTIIWTSSDKSIATVSKKGIVTGITEGSVRITAKFGKKKRTCIVTVQRDEEYEELMRDLAERDYINRFSSASLAPDTEVIVRDEENDNSEVDALMDELETMNGQTNDEIDAAYDEFCKSWIGEYDLYNDYGISVVWTGYNQRIYLLGKENYKYIIEGVLNNLVNGTEYEGSGIHYKYVDKFENNGKSKNVDQLFFNREDLISIGIIK